MYEQMSKEKAADLATENEKDARDIIRLAEILYDYEDSK